MFSPSAQDTYNAFNAERRLMRRQRLLRIGEGVALVTMVAVGLAHCDEPSEQGSKPSSSITDTPKPGFNYVVKPNETLSEIAHAACPEGPDTIAGMVVDLQLAGGLNTPAIHGGQRLKIPSNICAVDYPK